ncbi:putative membrane protein [Mycobacterium xenopi 4042]|uniref:Putative membrane protein n=1 Tax=Mycobacterium xenopi 4042 TaxID=1299334 RepID=X8EDG7_MYCXE|nr:putative membrane protein [Mycobacterium xenopi 4042]
MALIGVVALVVAASAAVGNAAAAVVFGFPLALALIAAVVYLYTVLSFAPVLIVLERLTVTRAIGRSFALVRNSFWRYSVSAC